ncbi:hypothetical protein CP532_4416 [Ophiocordyceps camponoti-leonardi (nom. inval.)]|nr:hypothetical protein CP532_4416 [Ophiocordyceps camponoti-leonardi (nom. inval.)]
MMITISLLLLLLLLASVTSGATLLPGSTLGRPGDASFDYVVVGGGTAGLVVGSRLAEGGKSVAVVEAGGFYQVDNGLYSQVPSYAIVGAGSSPGAIVPAVDWGFVTTPQAGMDQRRMHYARGRTLGGSSARNYFTYNRPTRGALNRWASEVDDDSYSFDNFLPFFKKSINYTAPDNEKRPANASVPAPTRGSFTPGAGPLHVSFPTWANSFSSYAKLGWRKLGFAETTDFVSGTLSGVQYCQNTINPQGQVRDSSFTSFLARAAASGAPIKVFNNTLAQRVLFKGKTATGVLVNSSGLEYVLSARHEVVVSCGAFQSPQLLMLSGIGPSDTLSKLGIPIVSHLPGVGRNLQDHVVFGTTYQVNTLTHSAVSKPANLLRSEAEWKKDGGGMLGNPGGELITWEKLRGHDGHGSKKLSAATRAVLDSVPEDFPTIEYLILDAYSGNNRNYLTGAPHTDFMYASPVAAIHVPQSRGRVSIVSSSASDAPLIDPNWLTHEVDKELAVYSFRRLRELMDTDVMRATWKEEVVPGRNLTTDGQILDVIRDNAIQEFHASCTCKMGRRGDRDAVVDGRGRVFGTKGLRVVDASALPFLPAGHPQGLIYALAEKLSADMLRSCA